MNSVSPQTESRSSQHEARLKSLCRAAHWASFIVLAIGASGVAGWLLNSPVLAGILPGLPTMSVTTAVSLLFLATALLLLQGCRISLGSRISAGVLAGITFFSTFLTALERLPGIAPGQLDHFPSLKWLSDFAGAEIDDIVGTTADITLILASLALLLLDYEKNDKRRPAQWLAIAVMASGLWTVLSYIFNSAAYDLGSIHERTSLNTAIAFIVFGTGVLLTRPEAGVMAIFSSNSAAGQMARRILPASILMLFAIGAATILGLQTGLYDNTLNNALFTIGSIILITFLVWRNAHEIDKTEQERERAVETAQRQREWLQVMLSSIADAVIATDESGRVQFLNPVAETLTGWLEREAVGRPASEVFHLADVRSGPASLGDLAMGNDELAGRPEFATLIARDGREIPIEDRGAPIRDSRGQLVGSVVVFRDVTERRRAEEMRQEVARQYATVAEAIPQMVWTAEANGNVDFFNRRWFEYTGLAFADSRGWLWQSAFHAQDQATSARQWRDSIASGSRYEVEVRIRRKDGACRWHLIRALPVLDRSGHISKWFGTCTDIDDQKRVEEAMRFLADASTVLSASLDEIGTLQSVAELAVPKIADSCTVHLIAKGGAHLQLAAVSHMDPKKVELMVEIDRRYPPSPERAKGVSQVILNGLAELTPEMDDWLLDAMAANELHREMLRELGLRSTICAPLRGHREILGVITFASMESGRRYTSRDVSLAEEVARRTALALDNNRLLAEITETKVEAEAANAAKDQFLAVLSHELRTPLTPVLLAVDELLRGTALSSAARDVMEMTRRNIELEARLIDDLLDLTRIQRGKLQLQRAPTDAHDLLRSALDICDADIRNKKLCVSLGLSAENHHVNADPARLQQVFWNLIKNSVKFTDSGGSVIFRSRNTSKGTLQIEVEDSGIGIDSSALSKIFNAFEQGEKSKERRFGGLGLGLAITRHLVEAHGGTIAAKSPGRDLGTTFVIELATIESPALSQNNHAFPSLEHRGPAGLRILLVEDNHDTGTLLRKILERRGYQVDLATSMHSAIRLAHGSTFDLLLSDIGLPDGSGLELMNHLRQTRCIPGIAMSGFGMDDDLRRSREAGFSEHLIKPLSIGKLEEAIEKITRDLPLV